MRADVVRRVRRVLLITVTLAVVVGALSIWATARPESGPAFLQPIFDYLQMRTRPHIGIVAGHSGYDPGAVCPDGLTEVKINTRVANAVADQLRQRDMYVEILQEFDTRLDGYQADAFVSIHADSCEFDLSGFKVASLEEGSVASRKLADCLWVRYAQVTGLAPHPDTITYDMRDYHAFREISPATPAVIIEIGFMKGDREFLTQEYDVAAAGIVSGIECSLTPDE